MENEIDKQEREIIESLEREEKEHKKYLASNPSGRDCNYSTLNLNQKQFERPNYHSWHCKEKCLKLEYSEQIAQ